MPDGEGVEIENPELIKGVCIHSSADSAGPDGTGNEFPGSSPVDTGIEGCDHPIDCWSTYVTHD